MDGKHYKLRILPLFEEDLNEIVDYISIRLQNPIAAENFVDAVETAISERLSCAESFEPYSSARERKYSYYCLLYTSQPSSPRSGECAGRCGTTACPTVTIWSSLPT